MLRLVNFMLNPLLGISIVLISGLCCLSRLCDMHVTKPSAMSAPADRPVNCHRIIIYFEDTHFVARIELMYWSQRSLCRASVDANQGVDS